MHVWAVFYSAFCPTKLQFSCVSASFSKVSQSADSLLLLSYSFFAPLCCMVAPQIFQSLAPPCQEDSPGYASSRRAHHSTSAQWPVGSTLTSPSLGFTLDHCPHGSTGLPRPFWLHLGQMLLCLCHGLLGHQLHLVLPLRLSHLAPWLHLWSSSLQLCLCLLNLRCRLVSPALWLHLYHLNLCPSYLLLHKPTPLDENQTHTWIVSGCFIGGITQDLL